MRAFVTANHLPPHISHATARFIFHVSRLCSRSPSILGYNKQRFPQSYPLDHSLNYHIMLRLGNSPAVYSCSICTPTGIKIKKKAGRGTQQPSPTVIDFRNSRDAGCLKCGMIIDAIDALDPHCAYGPENQISLVKSNPLELILHGRGHQPRLTIFQGHGKPSRLCILTILHMSSS